jgi:hypothetical protein
MLPLTLILCLLLVACGGGDDDPAPTLLELPSLTPTGGRVSAAGTPGGSAAQCDWRAGDPAALDAGQYMPGGGFGQLFINEPDLVTQIGWSGAELRPTAQ